MNSSMREQRSTRWPALWCACALLFLLTPVAALQAASPAASDAHPFAEHFLALQVSSADHTRQSHIISVAQNVLKHYGPDQVAIDVVGFGPGVRMLFADSQYGEQIESLIVQGVRFDACGNTLDSIERKTGKRPKLLQGVHLVQAGVPRLLHLSEHGYTIIQP